jgi:hypothetical protein
LSPLTSPDAGPYCRRPIRRYALRNLVEAARDLPLLVTTPDALADDAVEVTAYVAALARTAAEPTPVADHPPQRPDELRPAVAVLLARLARRAEPELAAAMQRAHEAWDQADSLSVIDHELESDIAGLRRRLVAAAGPTTTAARRAIALEGLLALDAAVALVRLFERRLAALLRLRLRSATPELLPEGRPFLDLGRALQEAAEAWR